MIQREEEITNQTIQKSLYYQAFEHLEHAASELKNSKIVVFIDDLDRCFPENAVRLLEGIKLVLTQVNFIFVLGLDIKTVASHISTKYSKGLSISGNQYIEKLFQVAFQIPDYLNLIDDYAESIVKRHIERKYFDEFKIIIPTIGALCRYNPRAIKRFLNNLLIDRAIAMTRPGVSIPISQIGFARALQMHWPRIAEAIQFNDEGFCDKILEISTNQQTALKKLSELSSDNNSSMSAVYEEIIKDRLLKEILFSKIAFNWLSNKDRQKEWELLMERPIQFQNNYFEIGEVYSPPKKGRIIDAGKEHTNLLDIGSQRERIKALWPEMYDMIVEHSNEKFWKKHHWRSQNTLEGIVHGTVRHVNTNTNMYLMEFKKENEIIFYLIGTSGAELIE
jgi:hypothetical protein